MKKATGIVRRIDDLGRIVIPKELRRTYGIAEGDPVEIYTSDEEIILRKYQPVGGCSLCGTVADSYAELGSAARICVECVRLIVERLQS
jgi:looped-hinge helix DNA binding domain, AbrB family